MNRVRDVEEESSHFSFLMKCNLFGNLLNSPHSPARHGNLDFASLETHDVATKHERHFSDVLGTKPLELIALVHPLRGEQDEPSSVADIGDVRESLSSSSGTSRPVVRDSVGADELPIYPPKFLLSRFHFWDRAERIPHVAVPHIVDGDLTKEPTEALSDVF